MANLRTSDLPAITSAADTDLFEISKDIGSGNFDSKKITFLNFKNTIGYTAHDIADHDDTTATGAQLNELVGGGVTALHSHAVSHNIADHPDTTATGAELETLTDGSNADALHTHAVIPAHNIADHDTGATGAELNTLTDGSNADALHSHALIPHVHDAAEITAIVRGAGSSSSAGGGLSVQDAIDLLDERIDELKALVESYHP